MSELLPHAFESSLPESIHCTRCGAPRLSMIHADPDGIVRKSLAEVIREASALPERAKNPRGLCLPPETISRPHDAPPFPPEPAFGSPEAVAQAAEPIRRYGLNAGGRIFMLRPEDPDDIAHFANFTDHRDLLRERDALQEKVDAFAQQRDALQEDLRRTEAVVSEERRGLADCQAEVERLRAELLGMTVARDAAGVFMRDAERQRDALADVLEKSAAIIRPLVDDDSNPLLALRRTEVLVEIEAALRLAGRLP